MINPNIKYKCNKCGCPCLTEKNFYYYKNGSRSLECKECDNALDIKDFCKKYNIPYIKYEFNAKQRHYGKYLATMKLLAYKNFTYADNKKLNNERSE